MHYVAPGVYLEREPNGMLKLSVEEVAVFEGRPVKVRIMRDIHPDKLRAIAPELFPDTTPKIADDVRTLREMADVVKQEDRDFSALITRVLDHYAAIDLKNASNPFDFSKPENVKGFDAFLKAVEERLEDA